ncbi:hypothetical protein [Desulfovibrio gilichinskyi]|uniref:Type VI secretion system spike protein VgrG3-like C-terminal domain-containing protein n=1 Tax=Desulfovibrio gilichinskyi TaxID=1519643 RepID=A0A1X7EUK6_9BACT|nr:hypothetical protein [Desulfovibrio gilichinskyi]SMF39853.1 hypothetical protein SAMN06295933_3367 [Desulfovibrio gilichinskyi]
MTNINDNIASVMKMLGNSSGTAAASKSNLAALKDKAGGFDMEMAAAGRMFSDNRDDEGYSGQGMDMGVMNNALMLEALTTLNSIEGLHKNRVGKSALSANQYGIITNSFDLNSVKNMSIPAEPEVAGELSAKFESGSQGVSAIGYDRVGGTSYGKYQIASNTGSMEQFIDFLKNKNPELAERLELSGPANTGSKRGRMPDEWRKIAAEDPVNFEKMQHDFIRSSHYDPAVKKILEQTGIDVNKLPGPLREVLWSTSVQHGATGASNMISRALNKLSSQATEKGFPSELVKEIYGERKDQFASSTGAVQNSVTERLTQEQNMVLAMLNQSTLSKTA